MATRKSNVKKKNRLLKKLLAGMSLLAISLGIVESPSAAAPHKRSARVKTRKVSPGVAKKRAPAKRRVAARNAPARKAGPARVARAKAAPRKAGPARVARAKAAPRKAGPARVARAKAAPRRAGPARVAKAKATPGRPARGKARALARRTPPGPTPAQRAQQARQQEERARQQARQRQQQRIAQRPTNMAAFRAFAVRPFAVENRMRTTHPAFINEPFPALDIGYTGPGRTQQYAPLNLPKAPIFHPYHPAGHDERGHHLPAYTLNGKMSGGLVDYFVSYLPDTLVQHLRPTDNIEAFFNIQDLPWHLGAIPNTNALLFRPQSWLDPDAPNIQPGYDRRFNIQAGVFSNHGVHIRGQGNGLVNDTSVVHDDGVSVVSSPPTLPIDGLTDDSQVLYSLVRYGNRVAVGRNLFLTENDQGVLERAWEARLVPNRPTNLVEWRDFINGDVRPHLTPRGQQAFDEFGEFYR